ncbi:hypothetical protein [Roseibium sp. RKSG952]|uniref:hypothetical protein n=1 Tax=Roseibium sp. RKSG952 TaxID=2529384 RepID=UPI0012BC932D|nr:hypothetical protein [Roseibium sp. RKSG952]MTH95311.1 hypothetical protein [Roseibium sp. RKSG952]
MTDARECILAAADRLTALEKAKVDLEAVKQRVADLKQEYDDQIAACEEAGLTKVKARKAVQGIVDVLVDADLIDLPAEKPKASRKPRAPKAAKQKEVSDNSSKTESSKEVVEQNSTVGQSANVASEPEESHAVTASDEEITDDSAEIEVLVADEPSASEEVASEIPDEEVPIQEQVSSNEDFGELKVVETSNPSETVSEDEINVFDDTGEEDGIEVPQESAKRSDFSLPAFMQK